MNAKTEIVRKSVRKWLSANRQWCIPVYQRRYAWGDTAGGNSRTEYGPTRMFWEDLKRQADKYRSRKDESVPVKPHYFGAVLVESQHNPQAVTDIVPYDVVDGQQRLTTISIAMLALIDVAHAKISTGDTEELMETLAKYLFVDDEKTEPRLKPRNLDIEHYENLLEVYPDYQRSENVDSDTKPADSKIGGAHKLFKDMFRKWMDEDNHDVHAEKLVESLRDALLDGFEFVVIPLQKDVDNAQLVFEAMNKAALPLTTFDLIRNNVLYRANQAYGAGGDQRIFKSKNWRQFELDFWNDNAGTRRYTHIEQYVARMLIAKRHKPLDPGHLNQVVSAYRDYADGLQRAGVRIEREVERISEYVPTYKYLVGKTNENPLGEGFEFGYFKSDVGSVGVLLPVIFIITNLTIDNAAKQRMILLLESWYVRRCLAYGITAAGRGYNNLVPTICKNLNAEKNYASLSGMLRQSEDYRNFPGDGDIAARLQKFNFYELKKMARYIFERIVRHKTSATQNLRRDILGLQIDHIMPQSWAESAEWASVLPSDYDETSVKEKINTIGNLTPMEQGLNAGKGNRAYAGNEPDPDKKIYARNWLLKSDLSLTREVAETYEQWNLETIDARTKELAKIICEIWPYDID